MNINTFKLRKITRYLRSIGRPGLAGCVLFLGCNAAAIAQQAHERLTPSPHAATINAHSPLISIQRAASAGDADAQYLLATRLLEGDGIAVNESAALQWLRKAARKGHVESQFQLGLLYLESRTLPEDEDLAYQWINAAIENGHPAAGAVAHYILSGEELSLGC